MKRFILGMLPIITFIFSCKKVLERNPLDSLTPKQAFSNAEDLQLYVNSFYQMLPSPEDIVGNPADLSGAYLSESLMSGLVVWTQFNPYLSGNFTSKDAVGWDWSNLRNINYFLSHLHEANISVAQKNNFEGIARFFRAWFYFDKIKKFGDVPWYSKELAPSDTALYKPRDSRTLVMDSVLEDIDFAVNNIDSTKDNTCSTITKWAALALKSRICLYEGTYRKYHKELGLENTASFWLQNSANAAKQIMNSNLYSIHNTGHPDNDYRDLFISENPPSDEVLLSSICNNNLKKWNYLTNWFSDIGKYQFSLIHRFVNTYLNIDGSRFTDMLGHDTLQFQNEVKNRDARLYQTIRTPSYRRSDGSVAPPYLGVALTGYQLLKFSMDNPEFDLNGQSYNSVPIMRYAEVLLNYAEAKAEWGTFTNGDWDQTIAILRKRAGLTNASMPTTLDLYMKKNFYPDINSIPILEIRRERSIELIGEGFQYTDLKRWKEGWLLEQPKDGIYVPKKDELLDLNEDGSPDVSFVDAVPANTVNGVYYFIVNDGKNELSNGDKGRLLLQTNITNLYQDYKYYAPIPYNQLVINPNLIQNPDWDHP